MEKIKNILINLLKTEISLMEYQRKLSVSDKEKYVCSKAIKQAKHSIEVVKGIKHSEILLSLYNVFIKHNVRLFATAGAIIGSKQTLKWDNTEEGFKEFLELESEAIAQHKKEKEEKEHDREVIRLAKEQGKQIEFVLIDKKLRPVVKENEQSN